MFCFLSYSPGFMMNLCNVLLQLSEPFFISKGEDKIANISPAYCVSEACRLDHDNERTLSGWSIGMYHIILETWPWALDISIRDCTELWKEVTWNKNHMPSRAGLIVQQRYYTLFCRATKFLETSSKKYCNLLSQGLDQNAEQNRSFSLNCSCLIIKFLLGNTGGEHC